MSQTCWCGAITDAYVCQACTRDLVAQLANIPALLTDLAVTVSRQDRLGGTGPALMSVRSSRVWRESDDEAEELLPAALRSRGGRITLPSTPWPLSWDAADLAFTVRATLFRWAKHLAGVRGRDTELGLLQGPVCRGCDHKSCRAISWSRGVKTDTWVVLWLMRVADAIRMDEAGPEIAGDVQFLVDALEKARDRRDPDLFAGKCDAPDFRVEATGGQLSPVVAVCGADLFYRLEEKEVKCLVCGVTYEVSERKQFLLASVRDALATNRQIADALTSLMEQVTQSMIRQMVFRGEIVEYGIDYEGAKLFRVGDVMDVLVRRRMRKAEQQSKPRRGKVPA